MRSRLNRIKNWEQLAEEVGYSTQKLAKLCGVSARTLERYFIETKGTAPHDWLNGIRQQRALQFIAASLLTVKEIAGKLAYKQASHFSREFKRYHGVSPAEIHSAERRMSQMDTKCRISI